MSTEYIRNLAEIRGAIEARDIRPGDIVMVRGKCDGRYRAHRVGRVERDGSVIALTFADGCTHDVSPRIPARLVRLAG